MQHLTVKSHFSCFLSNLLWLSPNSDAEFVSIKHIQKHIEYYQNVCTPKPLDIIGLPIKK